MPRVEIWSELGIAPTRDEKLVRKAYASRLRSIDQDADPDSFIRLRTAYEAALSFCRKLESTEQADFGRLVRIVNDVRDTDRSGANDGTNNLSSVVLAIKQALQQNGARAALDLYERASAAGEIPLGASDQVLDGIMSVVIADLSISSAEFISVMKRVGWLPIAAGRGAFSSVRFRALQRLEAEEWYSGLERIAAGERNQSVNSWSFRRAVGRHLRARAERRNARLLLRDRWQLRRIAKSTVQDLNAKLAQFHHYQRWVGHRFDPDCIKRATDVLDRSGELTPNQLRKLSLIVYILSIGIAVYFEVAAILFGIAMLAFLLGAWVKLFIYLRRVLPAFISDVRNRVSAFWGWLRA